MGTGASKLEKLQKRQYFSGFQPQVADSIYPLT